jgi:hypothetical protein
VTGATTTNGIANTGDIATTTLTVTGDASVGGRMDVGTDVFVAGRGRGLQSQLDRHRSDIDTNTRGIAMVAAMTDATVLPGMTNAMDFNVAYFEGETGFSVSYARRINDNLQIKSAVASSNDFDEGVYRVGVSYQW